MDNEQRAKLDSYNRISDFNETYAADIATIEGYDLEKTAFDGAVEIINKAGQAQAAKTGASKPAVSTEKAAMAETVSKYSMRGMVKARQTGNLTLASELDEPESYILFAPKTIAVQRAKELRDLMNDNLVTLTTITAANITEMTDAINAYDKIKDEPIESIQTKKVKGTDVLPPQFTIADGAITNMLALTVSYFGKDSEIARAFKKAMENINTGIRHTSILFTIVDAANAPVTDATVAEVDGKSYATDEDGEVLIDSHRNGTFHFEISAPGKQTVKLSAKIKRGEENDFTVKLMGV
ncbi:MAG TPA: carboxypeptidase-like regulatory domain-containing protein [Panacibacter sp.]|nr:carboxypeptidase-like regulatory domain-containing protein [Panacibacter sp.]